jgi:hypothetical protein
MDAALKKKLAKLVRLFGTTEHGERANAWRMLVNPMQGAGVNWSDVGNWIEEGDALKSPNRIMQNKGVNPDDVMSWIKGGGEDDFRAIYDAGLQDGIKRGVEQEKSKSSNGNGNGHITLPDPLEMAEFCQQHAGQLKDDSQRRFIEEMVITTRRRTPPRGPLGYLVSIYIKHGGRI